MCVYVIYYNMHALWAICVACTVMVVSVTCENCVMYDMRVLHDIVELLLLVLCTNSVV